MRNLLEESDRESPRPPVLEEVGTALSRIQSYELLALAAATRRRVFFGFESRSRMPRPELAQISLALASASAGGIVAAATAGAGLHSLLGFVLYGVGTAVLLTSVSVYWLLWKAEDEERARIADLKDREWTKIASLAGEWEFESVTRTSHKKARGKITFDVSEGRISGQGPVIGEKGDMIAEVTSQACGYYKGQFIMVYEYSSQDDNGRRSTQQCILSGFVKKPGEEINGTWRQLDWDGDGRVGGHICLTKNNPALAPNQATR